MAESLHRPISRCIALVILGLIALASNQIFAQGSIKNSGLIVNAEYSNTDMKSKTTTLKGKVQIAFRGQHLSCDNAVIDYKNQKIEATGNIRLQSTTLYAEATRLTLNYEAETAILENGFIQSGQVVFEGSQIQKIGPNTFIANEARYTACASCPAAWSFTGSKIEAELGGYAKISRPVLRVGGIPVIILPGILVPLKSARQSGLLVPSLEYSGSGGVALSQSFFWAISPSEDLTVTAKHYEFRGVKGLADYRYVLDSESKGELAGAFMQDRSVKKEFVTENNVARWFVDYNHYYALPDNFIQRAAIRQTSDLRYLRDFPEETFGHGDPALVNKISLTKNFHSQHLSIEASHHVNLLKEYPLAPNNDAVHKFPEIRYSVVESKVFQTPLQFKFDADYTNFTRAGFSYDDLTITGNCPGGLETPACAQVGPRGDVFSDGQFNPETDFIRTGQRLDLRPSISLPFRIFSNIEVVPELMYREAQYRFPIDAATTGGNNYARTASQRYLETNVVARTTFTHVYGDVTSPQSRRTKHEIEPEVTFSTIPWIRRPDHGFFGEFAGQRYSRIFEPISDSDLYTKNNLQFDYYDRVFDKQLVDIAITNRLIRKIWRDGFPDYDRILNFRISQSYDFYESRNLHPQPWSNINALLNARFENFETYTSAAYNPYAKVTNTSTRVKVFNHYGNYVQASYERIYLVDEKNRVINRNQTENIGLGLGLRSKFLDLEGQLDYSSVSSKVLSWQYVADLKPPGNCWVIKLGQRQVIGGNPEFRFNMAFDFGGEQVKKLN